MKEEPFVGTTNTILTELNRLENLKEKDTMTVEFSSVPFEGYKTFLERRVIEDKWTLYYEAVTKISGWLCPVLFKYFKEAPEFIYFRLLD